VSPRTETQECADAPIYGLPSRCRSSLSVGEFHRFSLLNLSQQSPAFVAGRSGGMYKLNMHVQGYEEMKGSIT